MRPIEQDVHEMLADDLITESTLLDPKPANYGPNRKQRRAQVKRFAKMRRQVVLDKQKANRATPV